MALSMSDSIRCLHQHAMAIIPAWFPGRLFALCRRYGSVLS